MHHQHTLYQAKPAGSHAAAMARRVLLTGDKDRHRARETHNVSILTQNNERRDHGRHGHDANLYQCPVFLLSLALGLPRTALRHRVVSRFCRVQESLPCQALGVCGRHATVCHHDRHPLGPALAECLRHGERWASRCAGPAPTPSTPAAQASLTSLYPPYAAGSNTATCLPRSAAWRASWRHCCCPAASVSRAKTSSRTSRAQSQRQPCTPKIATTRDTPAASRASASKAPSHTHSGPAPACSAAALKYPSRRADDRAAWLWGPALPSRLHGRRGSLPGPPASYGERPRGPRASRGLYAARCPALHSPPHCWASASGIPRCCR